MGLTKTVNTSFGPLGYPFVPWDTKRTPVTSITGIGKISWGCVYIPLYWTNFPNKWLTSQ